MVIILAAAEPEKGKVHRIDGIGGFESTRVPIKITDATEQLSDWWQDNSPNDFPSIVAACWWAVVTLTSLGPEWEEVGSCV